MKSKNKHRNEFSILIPTYEERKNLPALMKSLENNSYARAKFEVVFIDDDSPDGTAEIIRKLSARHDNLRLLVRPKKMGLGSAYKDGFKISTGNFIVEMDADLSHSFDELPKLLEVVKHVDVAVGSRYVQGGRLVGWRWHRRFISWGANFLARKFLGLKVKDATSGFRAYKRKAFEEIASESIMNGFEFQVEALHIAKGLGLEVAEVPIAFISRERGKSKLRFKEIVSFANAILKLRLRRNR